MVDAYLVPIVVYTSEPIKTRPVDDLTCSLGGEDETAVLSSTDSHRLPHFVPQPDSVSDGEQTTGGGDGAGEFLFSPFDLSALVHPVAASNSYFALLELASGGSPSSLDSLYSLRPCRSKGQGPSTTGPLSPPSMILR